LLLYTGYSLGWFSHVFMIHQRLWFPPFQFRVEAFLLAARIQAKKKPHGLYPQGFSTHFEAVD